MLVHCTAYAQSRRIWERRYRRWVDAVMANGLGQRQIVIVDDGSPVLPGWADTDIVTLRTPGDAARVQSSAPVLLLRYADRLGRAAIYDFPGWHRSFVTGLRYGAAGGFTKLLHLESDAYLISPRMLDWVRTTSAGWMAPWSGKFEFPEIAIQLICADQMPAAEAFARRPYDGLVGVTHETALPLTHVVKGFVGDRFGEEEAAVPAGADFVSQVAAQREPSYYWWLRGAPGPPEALPGRLELGFGDGQEGVALMGDGWSRPEPKGTWMVRAMSLLSIPAVPQAAAYDLVLTAAPHTHPTLLPVQHLGVQVNGTIVGDFDFPGALRVGLEIPGGLLRRDGSDRMFFHHTDARVPHNMKGKDGRVLALMLLAMSLQPRAAATLPG